MLPDPPTRQRHGASTFAQGRRGAARCLGAYALPVPDSKREGAVPDKRGRHDQQQRDVSLPGAGAEGRRGTLATDDLLPAQPRGPQHPANDPLPLVAGSDDPPEPPAEPAPDQPPVGHRERWQLRLRGGIVAGAVLGLLALLYGADLLLSRGEVPRGVQVAGVEVGGLERADAEQRLRQQIEPRLTRPVPVRAGDVHATLHPRAAGLTMSWPATLDQAGDQPLNPWTRLTSLFTTREVGVVTSTDREALTAALEALRRQTDRPPVEGGIRFEGATPVPIMPVAGQTLDVLAATEVVLRNWASGRPLSLPVAVAPVSVSPEAVRSVLEQVARPAVAAPITVTGEGADAVLEPEQIAPALRFEPDGQGGLVLRVDNTPLIEAARPQLAGTEVPARNAKITLAGGGTVVTPSADGRGIDWNASLAPLPQLLTAPPERRLPAVYVVRQPDLTTEEANNLGIKEVIGEFRTGGFAPDSGRNIRRVAEVVDGALVKPGETFSLNGRTSPRNAANGYVEAGIIDDGRPDRGIGGGVSQFATTLYNASYFAGMVDVEHKEHSYYISRYPAGREATVYEGAVDLKFRNDGPTGVLIQTAWTPESITVRLYGTKRYDVQSISGPRTNFTEPSTRTIPAGERCTPSSGSPGFTITDTRVLRDVNTGAERRETRTVKYDPQPRIRCGG